MKYFLAGLIVLLPFGVTAQTVLKNPLNDTGSNRCLNLSSGTFVVGNCPGSGQDGETGRDVTVPASGDGYAGFTYKKVCNNGNVSGVGTCPSKPVLGTGVTNWGCTKDLVTGLVWEIKTSDGGLRDYRSTYLQGDVGAYVSQVNSQGLCGSSNWRVPTVHELASIVNANVGSPGLALDVNWFPNTLNVPGQGASYMASNLYSAFGDYWGVSFEDGYVGPNMVTNAYPVRLVRSGTAISPPARYTPNAAGDEVTDNVTGLIWRRCVEGQHWTGVGCSSEAQVLVPWEDAIAHAKAEAARTSLGWRVPNRNELLSLVDTSKWNSTFDASAFPGFKDYPGYLWSSTVDAGNGNNNSWIIEPYYGIVEKSARGNGYASHIAILLVR